MNSQSINTNFKFVLSEPKPLLYTGGRYDKTRCYAPSVIKRNNKFLLYYTGSNETASCRSGYRLLLAKSEDGLHYIKQNTPVFNMPSHVKCYSSELMLDEYNNLILYLAINKGDGYDIYRSISSGEGKFSMPQKVISRNRNFSYGIHTLRILLINGIYHGYFAASSNGNKSNALLYPGYFLSSDFRIVHAISKDGINFSDYQFIDIPSLDFINIYGHSVFMNGNQLVLVFSAFDGFAGCKLYISFSSDFITFSTPRLLLDANIDNGEIGVYSTCVLPTTSPNVWQLFYANRNIEKYIGIHSMFINM